MSFLVMAVLGAATQGRLQPPPEPSAPPPQRQARAGEAEPQVIIVSGSPLDRPLAESLQGVIVLEEEELRRRLEPTLGETLAREPGISSTFFGPGASRPLIRGQGGERIRVLNDGIGNFDVSTTSVDHVVAADPLSADRIEIVRGPAALLYGDSAGGGVVNVIEGRIPRRRVDGVRAEALGYYGSNGDALNGTANLDIGIVRNVALHADILHRRQGDYEDGRGRLIKNSALRTTGGALGLTGFTPSGFTGANVSSFTSRYEIPGDVVFINASQVRGDFAAEHRLGGAIESVRARAGYADYSHDEIDDQGAIATTFANREFEGRIDLRHRAVGPVRGAFGLQYRHRRFEATGFEAFVPPSRISQLGLFLFERAELGRFALEGGVRYSRTEAITVGFDTPPQFVAPARLGFDTWSGSAGLGFRPTSGVLLGVSLYRTARAPALEELFANGPHAATGTYEIGDPSLRPEVATGVELTARYADGDRLTVDANLFATDYAGFVVEQETGEERFGLPVLMFRASDARFWGFELAAEGELVSGDRGVLRGDLLIDYVRAQDVRDDRPLPRIPPYRIAAGLELRLKSLDARIELLHVGAQDRVAVFEQPTPGHELVNANLSYRLTETVTLELRVSNLFDSFARVHTSFLRDRAPLAGRDLRLLVRFAID